MIVGSVNSHLEAMVRLTIRGTDGKPRQLDAVIDTGFNGSLTLPTEEISALGLPWRSRGFVILANGEEDPCDIHAATIEWDGRLRQILIEAADTDPLIGMGLLRGHDVRMHVVENGDVTIEARP